MLLLNSSGNPIEQDERPYVPFNAKAVLANSKSMYYILMASGWPKCSKHSLRDRGCLSDAATRSQPVAVREADRQTALQILTKQKEFSAWHEAMRQGGT
jgi:hypothetical protein